MPPEKTTNRICANIIDVKFGQTPKENAVGHTPLVYLNSVSKGLDAKIAMKIEYFAPGASVKDRPGSNMILEAERAGRITPGKTVLIEPTSGNMGIALAWTSAVLGYKLILVMPSTMSIERRTLLRAYGAELVLTDASLTIKGAIDRAYELNKWIPNSVVLNQFENPANIESHYQGTGPEIWQQTGGKVDIVCFGVGSGGTLSGVGTYLKEKNPNIRVYGAEPYEASVINGVKERGSHSIAGIGAGIIPKNLRKIYEEVLRIKSADAIAMAKRVAREEGILCGISAGANVLACLELAKRPENEGKLIVSTICDSGERYLSSILYKDIKDEVEKLDISTFDEDKLSLQMKFGLSLDDSKA